MFLITHTHTHTSRLAPIDYVKGLRKYISNVISPRFLQAFVLTRHLISLAEKNSLGFQNPLNSLKYSNRYSPLTMYFIFTLFSRGSQYLIGRRPNPRPTWSLPGEHCPSTWKVKIIQGTLQNRSSTGRPENSKRPGREDSGKTGWGPMESPL